VSCAKSIACLGRMKLKNGIQVCTFHDGCKQGIDQHFCWSIPCLLPSWKVHTWIEICASLNDRKKTKADGSRLIPRKHTETIVLLSEKLYVSFHLTRWQLVYEYIVPGYQSKTSRFRLPYQCHTSSANCARELYKGSNASGVF